MKTRAGFVSNSSSSSFILISDAEQTPPKIDGTIHIGLEGATEFGWQPERHSDFESKLNFAYLQTTYIGMERGIDWMKMLVKVLKEGTGCVFITTEGMNGYIDHQSAASEGANTEMFESEEQLRKFLFCDGSYVQVDNDNH